jgi:hypothetical protein
MNWEGTGKGRHERHENDGVLTRNLLAGLRGGGTFNNDRL